MKESTCAVCGVHHGTEKGVEIHYKANELAKLDIQAKLEGKEATVSFSFYRSSNDPYRKERV